MDSDTQSYVLNFHGRVTQASVKNFQIVHSLQAQSFDQNGHQQQRNSLSPDPSTVTGAIRKNKIIFNI
jgi:hypothetical protein